MIWQTSSTGSAETEKLGSLLGGQLKPPAVIELRSDLGGGKTTFVKGLAKGMGSQNAVTSPTFTLSQLYKSKKSQISHYDFYRLNEAGIMADEIKESLNNPANITVVEWGNLVKNVLPKDRLTVEFKPAANDENQRIITFYYPEKQSDLIEKLRAEWAKLKP